MSFKISVSLQIIPRHKKVIDISVFYSFIKEIKGNVKNRP